MKDTLLVYQPCGCDLLVRLCVWKFHCDMEALPHVTSIANTHFILL